MKPVFMFNEIKILMKKKNGINIMLFVLIINLFFMISCTKSQKQSLPGALMKADLDFSEMSVNEGMQKAFLAFFADSGVMLRDNGYPIKGHGALVSLFSNSKDTAFTLAWKPAFEKIAGSGELGYTYGFYTRTIKATGEVSRGTYVTIWEKQKDGNWKFVLDTGTDGLPEDSK
jgi:ketosteroid isomerase-like protein